MRTQTHRVSGSEVLIYFPEHTDDLAGFHDFLDRSAAKVLGLDTETTDLRIYHPDFACRLVQFGDEREAWVLRADLFRAEIQRALARPGQRFVAHNAPFDLLVLDRVGLAPLEDLGPRTYCTYVLAHLCDPRTESDGGTGLALKPLSTIYVDPDAADTAKGLYEVFRKEYKATRETGWAKIDVDHPLYVLYAGLDVIYVTRLLKELGTLVKGAGLSRLAHFEHRVQLSTARMQRRGLRVDVDYTRTLAAALADEAAQYKKVAADYGVSSVHAPRQIVEALQGMGEAWAEKTDTGAPSVGKDVLLPMADLEGRSWRRLGVREPNPLADAVVRAKRAKQWGTNYAQAFLNLRDENDRIHPFIKPLAARTARMSVSDPPLQQLPSSDWTIRRAIIADPGAVIMAADYKSMELRVLAALADVTEMKKAIAEGRDLHDFTATLIYGEDFTPHQRRLAKGVGLGKVFGGGAAGLARQIGAPLDQVQYAVSKYDQVYPEVKAYSNRLQRQARYGAFEVVTPFGRHLPLDRDRAYACVNYATQSAARDLIAAALLRIEDAGLGEHVLLPVHDELVCTAEAKDAQEVIIEIGRLMETDFLGVPIASDPEVMGRSWGSGYGCPPDQDAR